jgi:hypothetical protein
LIKIFSKTYIHIEIYDNTRNSEYPGIFPN